MAALDQAHRQAQDNLAGAVSVRLQAILLAIPDIQTQEAMEAYSSQAARLVAGGQHRSAQLALAYVARLSPPAPGKLPPSVDRALRGKLVDTYSPVATSPMLKVWGLMEEGEEETVARQIGASHADGLSSGDLQVAQRSGLEEGARAGRRPIRGWAKQLSGGACEWCREVAGQVFSAPDGVPFHQRDRCSVGPVFD
jgi:hypothetical protein